MEDEYKELNVKHFKLTSGDEILGLVAGIDPKKGVIHVEYPVLVDMLGNNYIMSDYMPTSVKNIVAFSIAHIIAQSDVHESVKHEYIKYCIGVTNEPESDSDDPAELINFNVDNKTTFH